MSIAPEAEFLNLFADLKKKKLMYLVGKYTDKALVTEAKANAEEKFDYEKVKASFVKADEPRVVCFLFSFNAGEGEGQREKLVLVNWVPEKSKLKAKMLASSAFNSIKTALNPQVVVQGTDASEVDYATVLAACKK